MLRKSFPFILFVLCIIEGRALAQTLPSSVVNATGSSFKNSSVMISFSVGETVVSPVSNASVGISQGFLFPVTINTTNTEDPANNNWQVYPNPTNGELSIATPLENHRVEIFDYQGKKQVFERDASTLNISDLDSGIYLLRISDNHSSTIRYFKILKY